MYAPRIFDLSRRSRLDVVSPVAQRMRHLTTMQEIPRSIPGRVVFYRSVDPQFFLIFYITISTFPFFATHIFYP